MSVDVEGHLHVTSSPDRPSLPPVFASLLFSETTRSCVRGTCCYRDPIDLCSTDMYSARFRLMRLRQAEAGSLRRWGFCPHRMGRKHLPKYPPLGLYSLGGERGRRFPPRREKKTPRGIPSARATKIFTARFRSEKQIEYFYPEYKEAESCEP